MKLLGRYSGSVVSLFRPRLRGRWRIEGCNDTVAGQRRSLTELPLSPWKGVLPWRAGKAASHTWLRDVTLPDDQMTISRCCLYVLFIKLLVSCTYVSIGFCSDIGVGIYGLFIEVARRWPVVGVSGRVDAAHGAFTGGLFDSVSHQAWDPGDDEKGVGERYGKAEIRQQCGYGAIDIDGEVSAGLLLESRLQRPCHDHGPAGYAQLLGKLE